MKRLIDVICADCASIYRNKLDGLEADRCPECNSPLWVSLQRTDETESMNKEIADICRRRAIDDAMTRVTMFKFLQQVNRAIDDAIQQVNRERERTLLGKVKKLFKRPRKDSDQ